MAKGRKRKTPVLVDDPDEIEAELEELRHEAEAEDEALPVEDEVPPEVAVVQELPPVVASACPKCGLPKADFIALRGRLRADLQKKAVGKCPRCGEPE